MLNQLVSGKAAYTVKQIQTQWPFLLTTDGLLRHFEVLMGFNISERFAKQFSTIGLKLTELSLQLSSEGRRRALELEAQSVMLKNDLPRTFGAFLLLRHYLGEEQLLLSTNLVRYISYYCVKVSGGMYLMTWHRVMPSGIVAYA